MSDVEETDGEAATAALEDYRKSGGVSLAEIEANPKPGTSPVCVESATLTKVRNLRDRLQGFTPGSWEASLYITANEIEAELINARSVADVRAEYLKELIAAAEDHFDGASYFGWAFAEWLLSLTEGEG